MTLKEISGAHEYMVRGPAGELRELITAAVTLAYELGAADAQSEDGNEAVPEAERERAAQVALDRWINTHTENEAALVRDLAAVVNEAGNRALTDGHDSHCWQRHPECLGQRVLAHLGYVLTEDGRKVRPS